MESVRRASQPPIGGHAPLSGRCVLFDSRQGSLVAVNSRGGIGIWHPPDWAAAPDVSPADVRFAGEVGGITEAVRGGELLAVVRRGPFHHETLACRLVAPDAYTGGGVTWLTNHPFISCSSDGRRLATLTHAGQIRVYQISPNEIFQHPGIVVQAPRGKIDYLAWSHDGRTLAGGSSDGIIQLRNASTLELQHQWACDTSGVPVMTYSPNDQTIAGMLTDGRIRLWNAVTGMELLTLEEHSMDFSDLRFSPDGTMLAAVAHVEGSEDGKLFLWQAPFDENILP